VRAAGAAALAATAFAAVTSAPAAEPFDGRWAPAPQACAGASAAASLLVIDSRALHWRDAACAVRTSYRVRGAWHIGARCWGEGAISEVPITLRVQGARLLLDWAGAPAEELWRCP
jgi:hypothetical protein